MKLLNPVVMVIVIPLLCGSSLMLGCKSGNPVDPSVTWTATWTAVNSGLTDTIFYDFAQIGTSLFAGGWGHGVFRSSDGGNSWFQKSTGLHPYVRVLETIGQNLYAGTPGGAFNSSDNGLSWQEITTTWGYFKYIDALASDGDNLYAGNEKGVIVTSDNGAHWKELNSGLPNRYEARITALSYDSTNLYAGTLGAGLFLLRGGDTTWTALGATNSLIDAIVFSGSFCFIATRGSGVLRSNDQGLTWTSANTGIANMIVNSLIVVESQLYAGVYQTGVFRSDNNGDTWTQVGDGLPAVTVFSLLVHNNSLYAATYGKGVWRLPLLKQSP